MERPTDEEVAKVFWYTLTGFEQDVFSTYQELANPEEGYVPKNKVIAEQLGVSRNKVGKARRSIAQKVDNLKPGW